MRKRPLKPKTSESIEETMDRLKAYCDAARGRKSEVARALLVNPTQVARWIARGGQPRLAQYLRLIEFLEIQEDKTTQ